MIRTWLAAATGLALMTGVAAAQMSSSSSTSTQTTTSTAVPMPGSSSESHSQRTIDSNGVVIDKSRSNSTGVSVTPSGDVATTRKSTESTTVR